VLFEATLLSGSKLARADILVKRGNEFDLLEVKAKLWDGAEAQQCAADGLPVPFRGKRGAIESKWQPYLEDVAYQVMVLRELFPDARVSSFLVMPDKSKTTSIDELYSFFSIKRQVVAGSPIERIEVEFTGDAAALRQDHFLTVVSVDAEVEELMDGVRAKSTDYVDSLQPELVKIPTRISVDCKSCEFRGTPQDPRDGFGECWGALGQTDPFLLDMYKISQIGGRGGPVADQLIAAGKAGLLDIDQRVLTKKDGTEGPDARRQKIQLEYTRAGTEWCSSQLGPLLNDLKYPLHFIDFETSRLAVPYHAGMRPYGLVAFQWSCHTIREPGGLPEHAEWLNAERAYPNFEFAQSLRRQIGEGGSVLTWATHEASSLSDIWRTIPVRGYDDQALAGWLESVLSPGGGRIVDMNAITLRHYFHPLMRGRTSIKWVLAAIWAVDDTVRALFSEYGTGALSPYDALPPIEISGRPLRVKEGTEAVRAYQEMMYGAGRGDSEVRERYARLLRQYCRLDSAAMIMVWNHWCRATVS